MVNIKKVLETSKNQKTGFLNALLKTITEMSKTHHWQKIAFEVGNESEPDDDPSHNLTEEEKLVNVQLVLTVKKNENLRKH